MQVVLSFGSKDRLQAVVHLGTRNVLFDECLLHTPHYHVAVILGDPPRHLVRHQSHQLTLGTAGICAIRRGPVGGTGTDHR
jgi:hypothetical protein